MHRVVLIGAGHAHLFLLRRAKEFFRPGFQLTLVSPGRFWYSGLATGVLGGRYKLEQDCVDPGELLRGSGAEIISDQMVGLYSDGRSVLLETGAKLDFDLLSVDAGSVVRPLPGASDRIFAAKPIPNLFALRTAIERHIDGGEPCVISVVGSGVTAFELAANIAGLVKRRGGTASIAVYGRDGTPLRELPDDAREFLLRYLNTCGIDFHPWREVVGVADRQLRFKDGSDETFTFAVNASGLLPAPAVSAMGLPVDADGALITDRYLRCSDNVFAAGDCIAFCGKALPDIGVYAVWQAPVLFKNLLASLSGQPLRPFVPQSRYLSIINLGDETALARYGRFWAHGKLPMLIKDWIDRRFVGH